MFALTALQPVDECLRLLGEVIMEQACGARIEPIVTICRQVLADLSVGAHALILPCRVHMSSWWRPCAPEPVISALASYGLP